MGAMKNINYDLIELLHHKLDIVARLETSCIKDAEEAQCHSLPALQQILEDERRHVDMIAEEIRMRVKADVFD